MITIKSNGKFDIPREESFIGYAGDNLKATKEIFVEGITDISLVYRIYLMFDDGSCNFFLAESQVQENGTLVTWNITNDQIFKGGVVQIQVKASNDSGEVFHSQVTTMLVQSSIEFTDYFKNKTNSEFLQHEEYLNNLLASHQSFVDNLESTAQTAQQEVSKAYESVISNINQTGEEQQQLIQAKADNAEDKVEEVLGDISNVKQEVSTVTETAKEIMQQAENKLEQYTSMVADEYPIEDSVNLITSGAVHSSLKEKLSYINADTVTSSEELDSMTDASTVYSFTLDKNVVSDISTTIDASLMNVGSKQVLALTDGRVYTRDISSNDNSPFTKSILSYEDFTEYIEDYNLNQPVTFYIADEVLTLEKLKDYRTSFAVTFFELDESELGNSKVMSGMVYLNGNNQIIKLSNGCEYMRSFTQVGTSTRWTELEQTVYSIDEITSKVESNIIETGSGTLTAANDMAKEANYKYTKIGNMVVLMVTATTQLPESGTNIANFTGLPYSVSNSNNYNKSALSLFISTNSWTYRVMAMNSTIMITHLNASTHIPVTPTNGDTITFSITYFTE